jgi:hypothetical protein
MCRVWKLRMMNMDRLNPHPLMLCLNIVSDQE